MAQCLAVIGPHWLACLYIGAVPTECVLRCAGNQKQHNRTPATSCSFVLCRALFCPRAHSVALSFCVN